MNKKISAWLGLVGLSIAAFLGCLDLTIVNTALPSIQNTFRLTESNLQWTMNILLLALTAFMVVMGKLADRYGGRLLLYIGLFLFAITSLSAGLSSHYIMLIFFRFFQGIAIAILYTAPVALIPSLFPNSIGKIMGILVGVSGFGLSIGPAIGGILTSQFGWHSIFFINIPLSLIAFLFCLGNLPKTKTSTKIDFIGSFLLVMVLPLFILTIIRSHVLGFISIDSIMLYFSILILCLLFVIRENRAYSPIIDFRLFANRRFIIGLSTNFFLAFFYAVDFFFIPLHLHQTGNYSTRQIGLILLPATMMVAILSPLSGSLCDRFGTKIILSIGYIFFIISALLQIQLHQSSIGYTLIPYVLFGTGWAFILSPSLITAISSLPAEMSGVAMGSVGTWHNFGGTLGLAIGSTLGYAGAMYLIFATSLLSLFLIIIGFKLQDSHH